MFTQVFSIEPLSEKAIDNIKSTLNIDVCVLDRKSFFQKKGVHEKIDNLICRDRDAVSDILDVCSNLKFLFIVSTGVEKLPFEKLQDRGVVVANTGGLNAPIMSEYAMAYILSQSARVCENLINQTQKIWKKFQCVDSLAGKRLLIVGAGRTGHLLAKKAKAFDMIVTGIKRNIIPMPFFDELDTLDSLKLYLPYSDFIVVTMPLTPESFHLFDEKMFALMKKNAVFINISRAGLVKTSALVNFLEKGLIGSAIVDVFDKEPLTNEDPLWNVRNLYVTPHSSGRLENFVDKAVEYFILNVKAFCCGEKIPNKVNLNAGY